MEHMPQEKRRGTENTSPLGEIKFIRQQVAQMGGNDSELPALSAIIEKVESGEIDSQEGLRRAFQIKNAKQDYH